MRQMTRKFATSVRNATSAKQCRKRCSKKSFCQEYVYYKNKCYLYDPTKAEKLDPIRFDNCPNCENGWKKSNKSDMIFFYLKYFLMLK